MARRKDDSLAGEMFLALVQVFEMAPWWLGPPAAVIAYSVFRWPVAWMIAPADEKSPSGAVWEILHKLMPAVAMAVGGAVLLIWIAVRIKLWTGGLLVDSQSGIESIQKLTWREFEELLCEAFRREGYAVEHTGTDGPDGGIDIRLQKGKSRVIVQCKHWKRQQVGVAIVREMFGLLHSEKADAVFIVTSGSFTDDAFGFASRNDIRLIDGPKVVQLIQAVQKSDSKQRISSSQPLQSSNVSTEQPIDHKAIEIPLCPTCGSEMTRRTATRGARSGKPFWGCLAYPKCRGIVNIRDT